MRNLAFVLVLLAGCTKPLSFVEYQEPGGEFVVMAPSGWQADARGPFARRPVAEVWWLGEMVAQHEGWPLGVMLFVRRLDRHPDPRNTRYRNGTLANHDDLFANKDLKGISVTKGEHSGYPARWVANDKWVETTGDNLLHGPVKEYPSRLRAVVIQTPGFYYVLEYRAVNDRFEKYLPAFEMLVSSFKLLKAPKAS